MLQALISFSDQEVDLVIASVQSWCKARRCEINSAQGSHALTVAINILQSGGTEKLMIDELFRRLPIAADRTAAGVGK